jgi:hypothetical protein
MAAVIYGLSGGEYVYNINPTIRTAFRGFHFIGGLESS